MGSLDARIGHRALVATKVLERMGVVRAAYVFGSHLTGTADAWSDKETSSAKPLVIGELQYDWPPGIAGPDSRPIELHHGQGYLIIWRGQDTPEFFIYRRTAPRIQRYTDFDRFLTDLGRFPVGSKLVRADTCSASTAYGMPDTESNHLSQLLKERDFVLRGIGSDESVVCTCESKRVVWYRKVGGPGENE